MKNDTSVSSNKKTFILVSPLFLSSDPHQFQYSELFFFLFFNANFHQQKQEVL